MRISDWSSDVCSSDLSDAALVSIDRAIALAPEDAELHFHRAGYLVGGRQLEAAQAALSQTVELDPNQFGAYVMQAQLALGRGDVDEAERLARLAARVEPRSEEHTSELQSLMRTTYAVFCLKKKKRCTNKL